MRPYPFVLAVCSPLVAQAPFQGNGVGGCELQASTAVIGGTLALQFGSNNIPNGIGALALSDGLGPVPGIGIVGLDIQSPATAGLQLGLDPGLPAAPVSPRGAAAAAWLADGMLLIVGGTDDTNVLASGLLFLP